MAKWTYSQAVVVCTQWPETSEITLTTEKTSISTESMLKWCSSVKCKDWLWYFTGGEVIAVIVNIPSSIKHNKLSAFNCISSLSFTMPWLLINQGHPAVISPLKCHGHVYSRFQFFICFSKKIFFCKMSIKLRQFYICFDWKCQYVSNFSPLEVWVKKYILQRKFY